MVLEFFKLLEYQEEVIDLGPMTLASKLSPASDIFETLLIAV